MKKRYVIQSCILVVSLILIVVLSSMAIFVFSQAGTVENSISTGTVTFSFTENSNGIEIIEAIPITDEAGKSLQAVNTSLGVVNGYFDFTVSSNVVGNASINYSIYIKEDSSNTLSSEYVKVYLTNKTTEEAYPGFTESVPVVSSLTNITDDSGNSVKSLYTDSVTSGESSTNYRLRIWVAEDYDLNILGQTYKIQIGVRANG